MKTLLPISSMLASVGFLLMAHGLMVTLLPLRGIEEGFSSSELGALGAFYFAGFGLGAVLGPRAVGRVGHIRTFAAMVAIVCIAVTAQSLLAVPAFWWFTRALTGFSLAALLIVIESWLNAASTNRTRGLVFSVYTVITLAVMTAGQLLTATAEVASFVLFAVATMLFAASTVPIALSRTAAPPPAPMVRLRLRHLFGLSPVAVFGALAVGWANGAFWTLGPVFAERETDQVGLVAAFMSVTVLAGAVGQLPLGWLSDRLDRRIVILLAGSGAALAAVGHVAAARYWPVGIFPCAAAFGFFALPLYALCAAHLNDKVEEDGYVEAASGLLLLCAAGAAVGPLAASALMERYAPDALFLFTGFVHASLVVFALGRICWRRPSSPAEKMAFTDALVLVGTVANLDPLSKDREKLSVPVRDATEAPTTA